MVISIKTKIVYLNGLDPVMNSFIAFFNKVRAEKFFLSVSLFFGLCFLFLTPPFQVPDEPNHFYRAWQVSQGGFISLKQDNRIGGTLPASLEKLIAAQGKKWNDAEMHMLFKIPLRPEEKKFYDFNNTALYSPLCYLPAAAAILVFKSFASPLITFYAARLALLLCWIAMVFIAIKIIPFYKWLFTFLALLPMSLFINMSINADVITNASCFLFIATVFNFAYSSDTIDSKKILRLCLLVFLLVSVKSVYAPFLLLLTLIPRNKFKTAKEYLLKLSAPCITGVVFFIFWSSFLNPLYLPYEKYNLDYRKGAALVDGANMEKQAHHILHGGNYLRDVALKTFHDTFDLYFNGYIGMFGWLENSLSQSFIVCMYVLIFLIALCESEKNIKIRWWHKSIIAFTFLLILFLVFLSQLLIWCYVGVDVVLNMQGRYFIPFMPLLFVLFYTHFISAKKIVAAITCLSVIISLMYCVQVLYTRYY